MLYKILLIYIIFIIVFLSNIDRTIWLHLSFDKNANIVYKNYNESIGVQHNKLRILFYRFIVFIIPFIQPLILLTVKHNQMLFLLNKPFAHPKLEMSLHSSIYYLLSKQASEKIHSKLFWNDIFTKYNINTPKIYGYLNNGNLLLKHDISFKKCILKPISGGFGTGIKFFDKTKIPKEGSFIIQEYIRNNGHYRIVTTTEKVINIYYCKKDKNALVSNNHKGGLCNSVDKFDKKTLNLALYLHKIALNYIDVIGWDIIQYENMYYFLEGNVQPGCVFEHDENYVDKAKELYNYIVVKNLKK